MSRVIEAKAIISAADRTGGVFNAIAEKIRRMQAAASSANRVSASAARNAQTIERASGMAHRTGGMIAAASGRVLAAGGATYGAAAAIKRNAEAELAVTRIGITADATDEQIGKLQNSLRGLAFESGKSFNEVKDGLESLTAGGMNLPEAMPALPAIAKTAQAAGAEVKDMATTTLSLNQAMGIATDKMQGAFDVMVAGGKAGKFELKDMARYFPSIAPAAAAIGLKGEEGLKKIVAVMQTIRAGTGTTEEAAASVQNIFAKMESEETVKKFSKFGVDVRKEMTQARKDGKDLITVFTDLTEKATKGDLSKIPQLFTDMEFARGMRALLSFKDVMKDVRSQLDGAAGSSMRDFERVAKTSQIAVNRLSESFDRLKTSAGAGLDSMGASSMMTNLAGDIEAAIEKGFTAGLKRVGERFVENNVKPVENFIKDQEIRAIDDAIAANEKKERSRPQPSAAQRGRGAPFLDPIEDRLANNPELRRLRAQKFSLEQARSARRAPDMPVGDILTPAERSQFEEIERERRRGRSLTEMNRPASSVPMPMTDPRKQVMQFPGFGDDSSRTVEAKLTGEAEVHGETTVKVIAEPGSALLKLVTDVEQGLAQMRGVLRANGPGSTGVSSPDARPGSSGIGSK